MNKPLHIDPQQRVETPSPSRVRSWNDGVFWSLLLLGLLGAILLTVVDDPEVVQTLERITTHEKAARFTESSRVEILSEHLRWWLLALPILAMVVRWGLPSSPKPSRKSASLAAPPEGSKRKERNASPPSIAPGLPVLLRIPPLAIGIFAFQILLGAGFLTGTWSYLRERFWFPEVTPPDEIRSVFLPKGVVSLSHRLDRILMPEDDVFVLVDPGETPVFLNYYLYPCRFYHPDGNEGVVERADDLDFWSNRRKEGFRWVYLYRPGIDPIGGGHLIELPRKPLPPAESTSSSPSPSPGHSSPLEVDP